MHYNLKYLYDDLQFPFVYLGCSHLFLALGLFLISFLNINFVIDNLNNNINNITNTIVIGVIREKECKSVELIIYFGVNYIKSFFML